VISLATQHYQRGIQNQYFGCSLCQLIKIHKKPFRFTSIPPMTSSFLCGSNWRKIWCLHHDGLTHLL
jgi:hypothetical protein